MASILSIHNEWRDGLVLASFRGVYFHVETSGRQSGRRTVLHQYPKRNLPYAEDMGREAVHWSFTAYILLNDKKLHGRNGPYANLIDHRNKLLVALEQDEPGDLVHPSLSMSYDGGQEGASAGGPMLVMVERYSISESRQKGGYYELDMAFVEAGSAPSNPKPDNRGLLKSSASAMSAAVKSQLKAQLQSGARQAMPAGMIQYAGPAAVRPGSLSETQRQQALDAIRVRQQQALDAIRNQ
jgi:hypothetical protein